MNVHNLTNWTEGRRGKNHDHAWTSRRRGTCRTCHRNHQSRPKASAAKWKGRRANENPAVVWAQASRLKQALDTARTGGVDFVFIDTAGRKDNSALNAARMSDLVLISTRPSILEVETLPEVNDLLRLAGNPPAFVLLNCIHTSARTPWPDRHSPRDQATFRFDRVSRPCLPAHHICRGPHVGAVAAGTRRRWKSGRRTKSTVRFHL